MSNNTLETQKYLQGIFKKLNKRFFNNELPDIMIYVSPTTRNVACFNPNVSHVFDKRYVRNYMMNFSDGILALPIENICTDLLHSMCHYYAALNGIKDTSRNFTYHNKRFKKIAEDHGLQVTRSDQYGWSIVSLDIESVKWCVKTFTDKSLNVYRFTNAGNSKKKSEESKLMQIVNPNGNPNSHSIKYQCPCCGNSVRATKFVNIGCYDCNVQMEIANGKRKVG